MAIQFIDEGSKSSNDSELPWLRDYCNNSGVDFEPCTVTDIYLCDNCLLVITTQFKASVFKRSSTYNFLVEALNVWITTKDGTPDLVCGATKNKKPHLGLDDECPITYWSKDGSHYSKKLPTGDGNASPALGRNPFLPQDTPPVQNSVIPIGSAGSKEPKSPTQKAAKAT